MPGPPWSTKFTKTVFLCALQDLALSAGSVAGEHIQEKLGRDDIARVVNLAPLVDIWGVVARLVEELAGEGIFRRFCNIILHHEDDILSLHSAFEHDLVRMACICLMPVIHKAL